MAECAMFALEGLEPHEVARLIPHKPVMVCYRGSIAHGTHIPPEEATGIDDVDLLCCYIPDLRQYFGLGQHQRGRDVKIGKWDSAAYEFRHLCSLLANGNPNVLSTLWVRPEHYLLLEPEGKILIEHRNLFLTKRAYHSFGGYAHAQLKRMTSFKDVESACGCTGKFHVEDCAVNQEKGRGSTKRFATGFMGEKRKGLVQKFGYDVKNAAHLIRLLRMGIELFREGTLVVDRTGRDAESLKEIKTGKWLLSDVQRESEKLFAELKEAAHASTLPEEPNESAIEDMMLKVLSRSFSVEVVLRAQEQVRKEFGVLQEPVFVESRKW